MALAKFNGQGFHYCKNCGAPKGIHRCDDLNCPNRGEDQTGLDPQIYMDTKFEPQDWEEKKEELTGQKFETLEGRTLFDDYFLASVNGLSISAVSDSRNISPDDVEDFPNILVNFAFAITKAALKKREEYFSKKEKA
jgi:hypothetical protein